MLIITLTNCGGGHKITAAQAAALPSTSLAFPSEKENSYQNPSYTALNNHPGATAGFMAATVGGGAIGGIAGALIIEGVQAVAQNKFEKQHPMEIAKINSAMRGNVSKPLHQSLKKHLAKNRFFANRMKADSSTPIVTRVHSYGLLRVAPGGNSADGKTDDFYSAHVLMTVSLKNEDKKELGGLGPVTGASNTKARLADFANSPSLVNKALAEAADAAAAEFSNRMQKATAELP